MSASRRALDDFPLPGVGCTARFARLSFATKASPTLPGAASPWRQMHHHAKLAESGRRLLHEPVRPAGRGQAA